MLRPNRREDGLAIVLVALLLLVFMAFASFAVDFGALYIARRADQNAADAGSLAGAQSALSAESVIAAQVIAYAEEDLGTSGLDWNSCDADTEKLADIVDGKNCITRDELLIRVKTPPRTINAIFGKAIGTDSYEHSAFAIAGLTPEGFGGVLPFGLFTSTPGHVCLRTDNPSTPVSPCTGSDQGQSGILDLKFYGSTLFGTSVDCTPDNSGGPNGRLPRNVANGVDHTVARRLSLGDAVLLDVDDCADKSDPRPNGAQQISSAGAMQGLELGLFSGDAAALQSSQPARLRRTAQVPYQQRITVEGIEADNTPLWEFIGTGTQAPTNVPDSCQKVVFTNALADVNSIQPPALATHLQGATVEVRMEKLLERCFSHYTFGVWADGDPVLGAYPPETRTGCTEPPALPCGGILFTRDSVDQQPQVYDIQLTPRFGYVPLVWETDLGSPSVTYKVFRPVFIQRLCIGNQLCNQGTFSPGVGWDDQHGSTSTNVHAVSAFAFHPNMLPGGLGGDDAPYDINVNLFLRLVR